MQTETQKGTRLPAHDRREHSFDTFHFHFLSTILNQVRDRSLIRAVLDLYPGGNAQKHPDILMIPGCFIRFCVLRRDHISAISLSLRSLQPDSVRAAAAASLLSTRRMRQAVPLFALMNAAYIYSTLILSL